MPSLNIRRHKRAARQQGPSIPEADIHYPSEIERKDRMDRLARMIRNRPGSLALVFAPMLSQAEADQVEFNKAAAKTLKSSGFFPDEFLEFAVLFNSHHSARINRLETMSQGTARYFSKPGLRVVNTSLHHSYHRNDTNLAVEQAYSEMMASRVGQSIGLVVVVNALDAQYIGGFNVGQNQIDVTAGGVLRPEARVIAGDQHPDLGLNWAQLPLAQQAR